MNREDFLEILQKYQEGKATKEEENVLFAYYQLFELQEDVFLDMDLREKEVLKDRIRKDIDDSIKKEVSPSVPNRWRWMTDYRWGIAAAIVVLVGVGFYFGTGDSELAEETFSEPIAEVVPGKDDATLSFADGRKIILNDQNLGVISEEGGVAIEKSENGELIYRFKEGSIPVDNTIATPRGGQYRLILADGTKVWLNAASSIRFPTIFGTDERQVHVTGEIYFEVARDTKRPFRVVSDNQVVEVLGTAFNINTYPEEISSRTTLIEGSVQISKLESNYTKSKPKILKPGQQALISSVHPHVVIEKADLDEVTAWKHGYFKFDRVDIQTIMRQVARWYDVEVEYRGELTKDLFVGEINRSENIEEVLKILRLSKVNAKVVGKKVMISN